MLNGSKVCHKAYGEGIVTDIDIRGEVLNSLVSVTFGEETKKFPYRSLAKFFSGVDAATLEDIASLEAKEKELKAEIAKKHAKEIKHIEVHNYDEYEHEVTKEEWAKAYKVAGDHRFPNESRAVVMDEHIGMFINASAAIRFIGGRVKDCDKIYKACELNRGRYYKHEFRYATKEDFENNGLV